jgi:hypothetical protein
MTHFTVLVAMERPEGLVAVDESNPTWVEALLDKILAPWDENMQVAPYRSYEGTDPENFWATESLRKEKLVPERATWEQVAAAYNARYEHEEESGEYLRIEEDRAYTMSTYNPDSKWDWWSIGGRWAGYFAVKPGHRTEVIQGHAGMEASPRPGYCDGGPKRALDFERMRDEKEARARERYQTYQELVAGTPGALSWEHYLEVHKSLGEQYTIEQARKDYHEQPRIVKLRSNREFIWSDPVQEFSVTEDEYAEQARLGAVPGYAMINLDGTWMAPGEMGWFGMSTDEDEGRRHYTYEVNSYIESLPDDVWLVAVDAHI